MQNEDFFFIGMECFMTILFVVFFLSLLKAMLFNLDFNFVCVI